MPAANHRSPGLPAFTAASGHHRSTPKGAQRERASAHVKVRTNSRRELYLVAYGVADERRLQTVHKIMRDFGDPLQYSVFVAALTPVQQARLEARLLQ
ncbi:MAG: CRISPR-associated endonuclease Cas2 [Firmicutes bacterium]|nr:CRISPR-associated endonuclease Cas2 [Bacillota bacterium]